MPILPDNACMHAQGVYSKNVSYDGMHANSLLFVLECMACHVFIDFGLLFQFTCMIVMAVCQYSLCIICIYTLSIHTHDEEVG